MVVSRTVEIRGGPGRSLAHFMASSSDALGIRDEGYSAGSPVRRTMSGWLTVQGVRLESMERGQGRPILWLHGEEGLDPETRALDRLATHGRVLAPSHPGFG